MAYQLEAVPAIFDMKVSLSPKEMNSLRSISETDDPIYPVLLEALNTKLKARCNTHGWVVPDSLQILSRSMGHLENGRYTANVIFHVQVQAEVLNPAHGALVTATVMTNNDMGIMAIYNHKVKDAEYEAIKVLVVLEQTRDLDADALQQQTQMFKSIEKGSQITVRLHKSRFQMNDEHILSVGELVPSQ